MESKAGEDFRELSELQDEDVEIRELIQLVKDGSLTDVMGKGKPELSGFTLLDGVLWYVDPTRGTGQG